MRRPALSALLPLVAAVALTPAPLCAQGAGVRAEASDSVTRIIPRLPLDRAAFSIVSVDGTKAILQLDDVIVVQLTDRGLARLTVDTRKREEEQGTLARMIGGLVRGGLRVLLDNAIEYEMSALQEVRYEEGRLVFLNREGKPVFDSISIDGQEFMESFAPRDARAFARRMNRLLAQRD
jgi:hypothetical protein